MSQNDFVIDNQSAPSARADINSALQALASTSSGATAPTTTYANQLWYDTANDLLKMRNEANSAWITLGTVDQTNSKFNPNFLPATQAEAEAGTENTKGMTPLRVSQAIAALNPPDTLKLLGTLTTTSGTTQTLSGLTLTGYAGLLILVDGVSHNGGTSGGLQVGSVTLQNTNRSSADLVSGFVLINLGGGLGTGFIYRDTETNTPRSALTGYSTASTSIAFSWSNAAAFDAGKIYVYGIRA